MDPVSGQLDLFAGEPAEPDVVLKKQVVAEARPEPVVHHDVDLGDYQRGQWPTAKLVTHPSTVLMRAVEAISTVTGWSGGWRRLLTIWWSALDRLREGAEADYMRAIEGLPADVLEAAKAGLMALIRHFHADGAYCDLLGPVHMEVVSRWSQSGTGQFFTPWSVCVLMAEMNMVPDEPLRPDGEPWSISDPAVGSGSTLLAYRGVFARRHGRAWASTLRLCGQDIDETCVLMARIQLRLTNVFEMQTVLDTARLEPDVARQVVRLAQVMSC